MRNPKITRSLCTAALSLALVAGLSSTSALAWHPTNEVGELEAQNAKISEQTSLEGMVLLDNHNNVLPIPKAATQPNIALYGCGAMSTVKGGTGSGAVNNRATGNISARQGFEDAGYNVTTSPVYWSALDLMDVPKASAANKEAAKTNNSCASTETLYAEWAPWKNYSYEKTGVINQQYSYENPIYPDTPLTNSTVKPTAATDTALYFVSRNSGEHWDRYDSEGDYELSKTERANVQLLGRNFKNVIVVINVGGIIDVKFVNEINSRYRDPAGGDPIDGVFLLSQAGQAGGAALPTVLNGTESPSGKLTDTWAKNYEYYPNAAAYSAKDYSSKIHFPDTFGALGDEEKFRTESYSEGIYVGYRYFDSFYKALPDGGDKPEDVVTYPFGYGLSYTDFHITTDSVTAAANGNVEVKATVQNVGATYTGKEVVEVYFSAPQNGLDKPYQELVGFGKTEKLAPGQKQQLTITFPTKELASYDEATAAYVLDAGDYVIRVGNSSRNTHVGAVLNVNAKVVTEQLSNQFRNTKPADEFTSDPKDFYTYPGEAAEISTAPRISLSAAAFTTADKASKVDQNVSITASDPLAFVEGNKISSAKVYLSSNNRNTNWEGTGAEYQVQTARGETVERVATSPTAKLYDVADGSITMNQFVAGLTTDQLTHLVVGRSSAQALTGSVPSARGSAGYTTEEYENIGIPSVAMPDGPAGLRITQNYNNTEYQFATAFPIAMMLAQSFNPQLIQAVGNAVGAEMDEYGASWWLAPALNLHRNPLCGRNFEYYSEDPLVSGLTAAYITLGVQSHPGRGVTLKHYAANNQEVFRSNVDEIISERAVREMYLKGFQVAVEMAQPMAIMSSYNKINSVATFQDYDLQTDVLRGEWDFKGLVMTDWSSVIRGGGSFLATQYAGNDLIMPGSNRYQDIASLVKPVAPAITAIGLPQVGDVIADTGVGSSVYNQTATRNSRMSQGFIPMMSVTPANPSQGYPWYTYDAVSNFRADPAGTVSLERTVSSISGTLSTAVGLLHKYNGFSGGAPTKDGQGKYVVASDTISPSINSVDAAYKFIQNLKAPRVAITSTAATNNDYWTTVLSDTEKAAITLSDEVYATPGDSTSAVTSYKVTLKGRYNYGSLRLGDLQRNAANILNVTMSSEPFQTLAKQNGITGSDGKEFKVVDYSHKWNLTSINTSVPGTVGQGSLPSVPPNSGSNAAASAGGVSGTPQVGQPVSVTPPGYWPAGTQVSYQWYANGQAIAGATGTSYTPSAADQGKAITVAVTGTNPAYAGSTTVTYSFSSVVASGVKTPAPKVSSVKVAQASVALVKGKKIAIPAIAYLSNGKTAKITWKSANTKIATVSSTGQITAKAKGKVAISATSGGKTAKITVNVVAKAPKKNTVKTVKATVPATLKVGAKKAITGTYSPANVTNVKVTYSSSKASVVAIDKAGQITAKAKGTATITVKAGTKKAVYKVTVK